MKKPKNSEVTSILVSFNAEPVKRSLRNSIDDESAQGYPLMRFFYILSAHFRNLV